MSILDRFRSTSSVTAAQPKAAEVAKAKADDIPQMSYTEVRDGLDTIVQAYPGVFSYTDLRITEQGDAAYRLAMISKKGTHITMEKLPGDKPIEVVDLIGSIDTALRILGHSPQRPAAQQQGKTAASVALGGAAPVIAG